MNQAELKEKIKKMKDIDSYVKEHGDVEVLGFFGGQNFRGIGPSSLSNFAPTDFRITFNKMGEVHFSSSEQAFMFLKAHYFKDAKILNEIKLLGYNPKMAKALGRKVKNFDQAAWDGVCEQLMYLAIKFKFIENGPLRDYLLSTGDSILVEASPYDRIWGCGLGLRDDYKDYTKWTGENKLGFLLMVLREELRK